MYLHNYFDIYHVDVMYVIMAHMQSRLTDEEEWKTPQVGLIHNRADKDKVPQSSVQLSKDYSRLRTGFGAGGEAY